MTIRNKMPLKTN